MTHAHRRSDLDKCMPMHVMHSSMIATQIKQNDPGAQKVLYGAFGLPFGLALIVICGGELFTANAAMLPAAIFEVQFHDV